MGDRFHGMARRAEGSGLNRSVRFGAPIPRSPPCDKGDNGAHRGRGTEGSNPSPSSGESIANPTSFDQRACSCTRPASSMGRSSGVVAGFGRGLRLGSQPRRDRTNLQKQGRYKEMKRNLRGFAAAGPLFLAMFAAEAAFAQKQGGILKMYSPDSPASMSIHEEATVFAEGPMMGVFNNLVMFDQHVPQNSLQSILPDLATAWSWSEVGTELTLPLREGVAWHDGKPFTARDVVCTFDLLAGNSSDKLRVNPRKSWYRNLERLTTNGDYEVTFHLKRPQPAFLTALASGFTPIYPCHVPPRDMRQHPIGTGPFKFLELKPNEYVKVVRNPDYWKKDRPYLDGIDWTIIKNQATGQLAFISGQFDMTSPYFFQVPLINDTQKQDPQAICRLVPSNVNRNVIINRSAPPFDNAEVRRAVALTLDRRAFIDTLTQGKGDIGG